MADRPADNLLKGPFNPIEHPAKYFFHKAKIREKIQKRCIFLYSTLRQDRPEYPPPRHWGSQEATVAHVWDHNFVISQPISTVLGVLESRGSVLSNAPKIVEIGWESRKFWPGTYRVLDQTGISDPGVASYQFCYKVEY